MITATDNGLQAMRHNGGGRCACCAVVALMCGAALANEPAQDADAWPERVLMVNASLGYQQWPALRDLDTQPFGTFDDGGFNISASAHIPWRNAGRSDLLLGADLGLMSHESSITAPGDFGDLTATVFYLAPSLRWSLRQSRRLRINLEAGAGAYRADLREFIDTDFGSLEGTRHFNAWAPGGFVGVGFDVPVGQTGRWSINTGARVHYADFGNVDAYGADLGRLDGPITTLQLGVSYDWNGKKPD